MTRPHFPLVAAAATALVLLAPCARTAFAHGEWAWIGDGRLTNPVTGKWCCGEDDCFVLDPGTVTEARTSYRVRLEGPEIPDRFRGRVVTVPRSWAQPTRDHHGRAWVCLDLTTGAPRCLFLYFGG